MARKPKKPPTGPFRLASFIAGIVVGCVASIIVASTAIPILDDYKPDMVGFPPNLDLPPKTNEYVFPDILERGLDPSEIDASRKSLVDVANQEPVASNEPEPSPINSFMLQVGSFEQQQHADTFRAWLILRGHKTEIAEVEISGIGLRYRVLVGPFSTQDEANSVAQQLLKEDVQSRLLGVRN